MGSFNAYKRVINSQFVYTALTSNLGKEGSKMYIESASMFNAEIESDYQKGYFLESTRDELADYTLTPKKYKLKEIGEHVRTVLEFKNENEARDYFDKLEFTKSGALILERALLPNMQKFIELCTYENLDEKIYQDEFCACFFNWNRKLIYSYTEGDLVRITARNKRIFDKELSAFRDFYLDNC